MNQTPSANWPVLGLDEARALLIGPGMPFEMEETVIRGVKTRVYKQARSGLRELFDIGCQWGRTDPTREYIVLDDDRQTYAAHFKAAGRLGRVLQDRFGVRKGDRVVIAMRNLPEWSLAFWAGASIGAVLTPLNAWGLGPDLAYGVENSGATVAIVDGDRLERLKPHLADLNLKGLVAVRTAPEHLGAAITLESLIGPPSGYGALPDDPPADPKSDPDDDATILYTSGTTGKPKGALGTHRNAMHNLISIGYGAMFGMARRGEAIPAPDPNAAQRTTLLPVPFFHVTGCHSIMMPTVTTGGRLILMHRWNPERFLELIETEKVNGTTGVPSMVWQVLESPDFTRRDLSSLDSYSYGGAAVAPELTRKFAEVFPNIRPGQGYGATETSSVSTVNSAEDFLLRTDSVGRAVPVADLKVMDAEGTRELAVGEVGELWIRGPNVVKGYWANPDATAKSFTDGWYHTGDIVRMDADGFVYILDRAKDMLIRGGENIYCVEIEDVLITHPALMDAAVVGLPHKIWGEEVAAVVRVKVGFEVTHEDIKAHVAARLSPYKVPVLVDIRTEELPKNASGKTLKPELRAQLVAARGEES